MCEKEGRRAGGADGRTEERTGYRTTNKDVGKVVFERDGLTCSVDVTKFYACQAKRRLM